MRLLAVYLLIPLLALVGMAVTTGNHATIIRWYAHRKRGSLIPALGGLLLAEGALLSPAAGVKQYAWIPVVIDPGCFLLFAGTLLFALRPSR